MRFFNFNRAPVAVRELWEQQGRIQTSQAGQSVTVKCILRNIDHSYLKILSN